MSTTNISPQEKKMLLDIAIGMASANNSSLDEAISIVEGNKEYIVGEHRKFIENPKQYLKFTADPVANPAAWRAWANPAAWRDWLTSGGSKKKKKKTKKKKSKKKKSKKKKSRSRSK
jgi:hypothetical protein